MGLFDKLKKILVGETTNPPKKEKVISSNDLKKEFDENNNDNSKNTSQNSTMNNKSENNDYSTNVKKVERTIEEFYIAKEEDIFNNIIFANLFNSDNKYSDHGIFNKSEPYLKVYFENYGYDWESNRDKIFALYQKSGRVKIIGNYLEENYNYYITNRISFSWSGHFADWLKIVIDKSIADKKSVTKQYARMIVANYYYKDFGNKGSKEALYKNLISMISAEEFKTWIINNATCFDNIIQKIEKRFKKEEINDIDERVLITQIVKSKLFQQALVEYPYIKDYATISKYSKIYNDAIHDDQVNIIDLNVKNVIEEKKIEEKPKEFVIENKEQSKKEVIGVLCESLEEYTNIENTIIKEKNKNIEPIKQEIVKERLAEEKSSIAIEESVMASTQDDKNDSKNIKETESVNEVVIDQNITEDTKAPAKKSVRKTDDFDKALKKLGGNRNVENNSVINFLENIKEELISIDESYDFKYDSIIGCSDVDFDEEIDNLLHY